MSQVRLAVRYRRGQGIKRWLSETSTLTLEIIDYPGEWLLDLPLLQMDYAQWCQQQQALFTQPIHAEYAQAWRQAVALCEADAPADVTQIETLSRQYAEVLQRLQQVPPAMSLLQPGRMLLPGELAQTTRLQFFPLLCPFQLDQVEPDSMLALLNDRFEAYKEQVVLPFYRDHFCHFDRQVVLVDGLKTLNHGEACFKDMQLALQSILQNFQYGHANFIQRLWRPRIDKVLFAMTKADHVTANQHANLEQFLTLIVDDAQRQLQYDGIESRCMALASVRSTVAAQTQLHGQQLSCLKGRLRDSDEEVALFPGEVPTELPSAEDWNSERFQFLDFAPLPLAKTALHAQHHIRLDQALEYFI
jgi:predicted YcjX-like family ATPase